MLTPIHELDTTQHSICLFSSLIALDPTSGNFLRRAALFETIQHGMYIYHVRGKTTLAIWAGNDQEAILKANNTTEA